MKLPYVGVGFLVLAIPASLIFVLVRPAARAANYSNSPDAAHAAVVVELFTSEGCSSCPPADALLARLSEQSPAGGVQILALEEHVDYWNDLGWNDPFSSREWTERQNEYASALGNRNPYTPQMVVDGSAEFVGSRGQQALKSIGEAAQRPKVVVTLTQGSSSKRGSENFSVTVGKLSDIAKGGIAEVWLAITESGLHNAVTGGENAGHELRHAAIVRSMRKIGEGKGTGDISFSGEVAIPVRSEWKRENLRAVVFVQEKKSLRIVGAAQISLH
ncbi:MAG TPA: DUF1223 domain-containing protein [Methylomirabilota bacterium]|nr:DUF1223 domain-containing protein [Methylomirabilota bacterium]